MAITKINVSEVEKELKNIDGYIEELERLYSNVNPDLTSGWDSETSKTLISPKIQDIKDSISAMRQSVQSISSSVSSYSIGMVNADEAGAGGSQREE